MSSRNADSLVPDSDQGEVLGNIEGLQMTASSRINSNTSVNKIDETRVSIAVEGGDLLVNERNFDRQAHTHHTMAWLSYLQIDFFEAIGRLIPLSLF